MKAFILRVKFALQGWVSFFRKEANGQIQLFIAVMVIVAGFGLQVSITEWMILLSCIGVVISLEMINSAIEKICNHVTPEMHPAIKVIKDDSPINCINTCCFDAPITLRIPISPVRPADCAVARLV